MNWIKRFDKKLAKLKIIRNTDRRGWHMDDLTEKGVKQFIAKEIERAEERGRIEEVTRCVVRLRHIINGDKETIKMIRKDFVDRIKSLKKS